MAWQSVFVSQLIVKMTCAPRNFRACDAAPMPSKKLMWSIGWLGIRDCSSCWMRGISGGGVAAVSAPCCPYCHCGADLPFFPPLPLGFCPLGGAVGGGVWTGLALAPQCGGGGVFGCHCGCCVCCCHGGGCCQNGFDGWDGKGCWYGCVLYRRGKQIGRNGCLSDLYLPLPLPLGGLSLLAFLETGWERMSVSWMVSCRMSVLASLNVTPDLICMASCQEKVFQASLTCGILSVCRRMSCSNRWM